MSNTKDNKPKCVYLIKRDGKVYRYMTRVIVKGKTHYLGCYKTQKEATKAYEAFKAGKNPR